MPDETWSLALVVNLRLLCIFSVRDSNNSKSNPPKTQKPSISNSSSKNPSASNSSWIKSRNSLLIGNSLQQRPRARLGELWIVDGAVHLDHRDIVAQVLFEIVEQRFVGSRIIKFLPGRADDADGFQWNEHRHRAGGEIDFLRQDFSEFCAFVRRRAHQHDLRIVLIEIASFEFGR